jgi:cytochrome c
MRYLCLVLSFVFFSTSAFAASEAPTRSDAKALVLQAVAFAKANGRDRFFNEVRSSNGKFHFKEGTKKDLYIFVYDEKGTVLAHGVRLELTGKNRWNDKDPDGKYWIRDWTELVHGSGSGWISYKEFSPADKNKVLEKHSFVELVDGMIIGCGVYGK